MNGDGSFKSGAYRTVSRESRSTTRFPIESDSRLTNLDDRLFDYRSSRRRSSIGKYLQPRLSIATVPSRTGNKIKFDVDKEDKIRKGLKQTPGSGLTLQALKESLELKPDSRIFYGVSSHDLQSPSFAGQGQGQQARFTGELYVDVSSRYTETELPIVPWSLTNSRFVSVGNSSDHSVDNIWPWPWLPSQLSSSEFIAKKVATTFSHQNELLMIPFMSLDQILKTYLRSVTLFMNAAKVAWIKSLLQDFLDNGGQSLHSKLELEHKKFLGIREELGSSDWVQRYVPGTCLTRLEAPLINNTILAPFMWDLWPERPGSQLDRAVILIQLVAEFARLVHSERLNTFYDEAGYLLCNHQYRKLFASSRIPGIPVDATHCFFKTMFEQNHHGSPGHIIVICRGQMFSLDILLDEKRTVPIVELRMALQEIMRAAEEMTDGAKRSTCRGVGVLTSMDRDVWSETRVHLMELSAQNRACLQRLEQAMFVLSLDHTNSRGPERLTNEALFADGCNRWYDKCLSFYLYNNGLMTVSVCSSVLDGSVVNSLLRFIHIRILEDAEKWDDEVYKKSGLASRCVSSEFLNRSATLSQISNIRVDHLDDGSESATQLDYASVYSSEISAPYALVFDLDETLENAISEAKLSFNQIEESLSSTICHYRGFEMNFFEDRKINVDAFAHLAIQFTFFKMYFRPPAVGSKIELRRFYHARYDTMATTTKESIAWCRAMYNPDVSTEEKVARFCSAVDRHVKRLEEISSGNGSYHYLSALRELAISDDDYSMRIMDEMSEVLAGSAETMDISCVGLSPHDSLSVAVVSPPSLSSYGVGYAVCQAKALFTVCAWKNNPSTSAELFAGTLFRCLGELRKFLLRV